MNERQIKIARYLAQQALNKQRPTYRNLASDISWPHPTGRGLGKDLWEILNFTQSAGLPCLTSILCKAGTPAPPDNAMAYINQIYGEIDLSAEQKRVFSYPWEKVAALGFELDARSEINFDRIYATRIWGFSPETWGMTGFSYEITRERILNDMGGQPIYIVHFCSQNSEPIEGHKGRFTIRPDDVAKVIGIVEAQPIRASHDTHTSPEEIENMVDLWGETRWNFGLENSRAWKFSTPPWTKEVLPNARSTSWEATRGIVSLTDEEKSLLRQYQFNEVDVYGQERREVSYALREPMHTTYLAICDDPSVLAKTAAPPSTKLVKIGVSGNTDRRLSDLNDHHFAKIFGLSFRMYATQRWPSQSEALARETYALEWASKNAERPASGEYFYMTDSQINEAILKVKPPKIVR